MQKLGARLEKAAEMLNNGGKYRLFADIGSDHAYLAAAVLDRGIAERAVAADINPAPLMKGKENFAGRDDIDFVLSDGFDSLESLCPDCAAICGMGGETIAAIISRSAAAKKCFLVLQPMTRASVLRGFLWDNGYEITAEDYAVENKKVYAVIAAVHTGAGTPHTYADLYLGKHRPATEEFALYAEKTLAEAEKRRRGGGSADIDELIKECQTQTTYLSGTNS